MLVPVVKVIWTYGETILGRRQQEAAVSLSSIIEKEHLPVGIQWINDIKSIKV